MASFCLNFTVRKTDGNAFDASFDKPNVIHKEHHSLLVCCTVKHLFYIQITVTVESAHLRLQNTYVIHLYLIVQVVLSYDHSWTQNLCC